MSLSRSAWKQPSSVSASDNYLLMVPEEGVFITFTALPGGEGRRLVWGCWVREEPGSIVYTALRGARQWRRESYEVRGTELRWNNGGEAGVSVWSRIEEQDIPPSLLQRGRAFLQKHQGLILPAYPPEKEF